MRLQRTFLWSRGYSIYPNFDQGPVINAIYGPISALAYWPATWVPFSSIVPVASACAAAFFFLPVLWVFLRSSPPLHKETKDSHFLLLSTLAFFCFFLAATLISSLKRSAFGISADAPALGLGALACSMIYFRNPSRSRWNSLFFAGLFSVLALGAKQTALPLVFAIGFYLLCSENWKSAGVYFLSLFFWALILAGIFSRLFDLHALYYNTVVLPSHHSLNTGWAVFAKGVVRLVRENGLLLAIGGPVLIPALSRKNKSLRTWLQTYRWSLFLFTAFFMAPFALMAHIKIGGSNNTLSFVSYFVLMGVLLAFLDAARRYPGTLLKTWARGSLVFYTTVLLFALIPLTFYRNVTFRDDRNFAETAFRYASAHPGTVYFPRMTLIHLLAEGKVYHETEGLIDRAWANLPVSREQFEAHLPKDLQMIAFPGEDHRKSLPLSDFRSKPSKFSDLPSFKVYLRKSPSKT